MKQAAPSIGDDSKNSLGMIGRRRRWIQHAQHVQRHKYQRGADRRQQIALQSDQYVRANARRLAGALAFSSEDAGQNQRNAQPYQDVETGVHGHNQMQEMHLCRELLHLLQRPVIAARCMQVGSQDREPGCTEIHRGDDWYKTCSINAAACRAAGVCPDANRFSPAVTDSLS